MQLLTVSLAAIWLKTRIYEAYLQASRSSCRLTSTQFLGTAMFRFACLVSLLFVSVASAEVAPKEGAYYSLSQVGVTKQEVKGSSIHLTFKPRDEQFYWCPGVKIQRTPLATVVTFVRAKTSENADVTVKAAIGKHLLRTVSIPTNGMDVYVRDGADSFKRIHAEPKSEDAKTKPASVQPATSIQMPATRS